MPRPSSLTADHDFGRFAADRRCDRTFCGLAGASALCRRLDAVGHGVAQHVFERRLHALEQVAVHFALCTVDLELGALAAAPARPGAPCGAGSAPCESNGTMRVRMRPSCKSELTRDCCNKQRFGLARQIVEQALNGDQVGH